MGIERSAAGFWEWLDHIDGVTSVGVESGRVAACLARFREVGHQGLFGCPDFGFHGDNLDFLREVPSATWLWFWDVNLTSIDGIYDLPDLRSMGIHPKRPGIDFGRLSGLDYAFCHWNPRDVGLAESSVRTFHLWHYNPRGKTFEGLEVPLGATELQVVWANPADLAGLPRLERLTMLQLHRCRNLTDLSLLPRIAPNLRELRITTSARAEPTTGIADHPTLQTALIDGREWVNR